MRHLHARTTPLKPLALALLLAHSPWTFAQAPQQLAPIVVSAQRGNETNTVVEANRIEVEQAISLQDLFRQTPEVSIGGGGLPVAQKLYVRGISERMLSITIDGAAQAESAYHHTGQVMIEPELLKRVEIEAGTGAATAGPGALAGALRFTTKSASDLLREGERAGALLKASYQSSGDGNKLAATVFGRLSDNIDMLVSATRLQSGDYEDGNGREVANTGAGARDGFAKLGFKSGGHQLQLSHERNRDEGFRNKRTNLIFAGFNASDFQRSERESSALHYAYAGGDPLLNATLTAYTNENAILLAQGLPAAERDGTRSDGLNLANVSRIGTHKLSYGLDYRQDTGFATVAGRALRDEKASVSGAFVQDDIALGDSWLLGAGARYDRYRYTDMVGQRYASSGASPSASLAWLPNEELTVRLSHARALRGVGVIEPFLKAIQTNAAHLDPERARNSELGVQWQRAGWHAGASVFRQQIDNFIAYDEQRQNLGQVKVGGYNASAGYTAGAWSASLGLASARPTLNGVAMSSSEALLLGNASGRTWAAQLDHALPAQNLKLGWTSRFVEKLGFVPEGAATKPAYGVHDAYVQWQARGSDKLVLTVTVKNLFDKFYYDHSSFGYHPRWGSVAALPETGRDLRATIAMRF